MFTEEELKKKLEETEDVFKKVQDRIEEIDTEKTQLLDTRSQLVGRAQTYKELLEDLNPEAVESVSGVVVDDEK